ncbi:MAG: OadG family protein [Roseburia sp.]
MKKKISLLLCMIVTMMTMLLAACGTDPTTVDYNGYSYDELKTNAQGTVSALVSMTEEEKEYYLAYSSETLAELINSWDETVADLGAYQGLGEFTVTKSGKTLSTEQVVVFEERDVVVTYVYNYNSMEMTGVTVDKVYTLGETMSKAGLNTLMGIGTVFVVLILISLIIYCFNIFPYLEKKKAAKKATVVETSADVAVAATEEVTDDLELIAVISAAIAASEGTSTDSFVVRSIHRR